MNYKLKIQHLGIIVVIGVLLFLIRNIGYIVNEFVFRHNINVDVCRTCSMKYKNRARQTKKIPKIIHQIFYTVKTKTPNMELLDARASCINANQNFTHYLWNETEVVKLIRSDFPNMEKRYWRYDYWVRRVNVARYLILYHYGGWYFDLDTTCKRSIRKLGEEAFRMNKSVIQHKTFPVGTSNDFFGITPRHQFLKSVLDHLPNSDRWFIFPYYNTVLSTGTTYMWGRYLNYPYKEEFYILEETAIKVYVQHNYASSWQGWDAQAIAFFIRHCHYILLLCFFILIAAIYLWHKNSQRECTLERNNP